MVGDGGSGVRRSDFKFDLPQELIAQVPVEPRTASRLLQLDGNSGAIKDGHFSEVEQLLRPGDLLIANNTRVIPARLRGHKESGGRAEVMLERVLDERRAIVQIRCSKKPKPQSRILFSQGALIVDARQGDFWLVSAADGTLEQLMATDGHMPLPPYIERDDDANDRERYQTVYADRPGAVAAPTAGLHFDNDLLDRLRAKGVHWGQVTLHVGAGTFQPVRVDDVRDHRMHKEWLEVSPEVASLHREARGAGGRVIAVGTTTLRALESACDDQGVVQPFSGDSDIFIYPGRKVHSADVLITNFHLPESTLLMLVSAFSGTTNIQAAYRHAVNRKYRFFSYGDACWLTRKTGDGAN